MSKLIYTLFILVLALFISSFLSLVEDFHLAGCYFSSGIVDTFGVNDIVPAGGYLVIAKRASAMQAVFGISPHQWKSGSLNNGGEVLTLLSPNGAIIFSLDFGANQAQDQESSLMVMKFMVLQAKPILLLVNPCMLIQLWLQIINLRLQLLRSQKEKQCYGFLIKELIM